MWAHMHKCRHTHTCGSLKHSKTCYLEFTFWRSDSSRLKDETVLLSCPLLSEEEEEEGGREEWELGQRQEEVKETWGRDGGKHCASLLLSLSVCLKKIQATNYPVRLISHTLNFISTYTLQAVSLPLHWQILMLHVYSTQPALERQCMFSLKP